MAKLTIKTAFYNPRIMAMLCIGFSSGLPLALTSSTLQAWFTESGVNIVAIGALSLVGMPYVWKFLWAPIMDRFAPMGKDKRHAWIFITQIGLCVALFLLASFNPVSQPKWMGCIALLIAFFSASQDTAIDAYRTDVLSPEERGVGAAYFIFAYRMAMLVSGGLSLVLADHFGWRMTYQLMSILLVCTTVLTYFTPSTREVKTQPQNMKKTIIESFKSLFQHDAIVLLLLFAVFYKLGDAFALTLLTNFLLHGLGFTLSTVGIVYKTVSLAATILGALVGGALLIRMNMFRALLYFGIAQAFSTLLFMVLAIVGKNYACLVTTLFVESFCSGMGTAAFMAFLMSLCDKRYTATQYACLSALSAIGRVFLGPLAGLMVLHVGWVSFYAWAFIFSFPGLIILGLLRNRVSFNETAIEY